MMKRSRYTLLSFSKEVRTLKESYSLSNATLLRPVRRRNSIFLNAFPKLTKLHLPENWNIDLPLSTNVFDSGFKLKPMYIQIY